jgi:DNA-binding NarL/FixJ family response regulator
MSPPRRQKVMIEPSGDTASAAPSIGQASSGQVPVPGLSNRQIGAALRVSEHTVKSRS